jgi:hypothetical protein
LEEQRLRDREKLAIRASATAMFAEFAELAELAELVRRGGQVSGQNSAENKNLKNETVKL